MIEQTKMITMSFVGDILPCNMPYTLGIGHIEDRDNIFNTSKTNKKKPDIFFAYLESPILNSKDSNIPFSGNTAIIPHLKESGINILSVANNHILEHGEKAFFSTIKILKTNGLKVVGIWEDGTSNIELFEINNQKIGVAAFNSIHDIENPNLYANLNKYSIKRALEKMHDIGTTFKILSFHWGNEYIDLPNPQQLDIAKYAIELGCNLIIGHHPHVVQKVEIINNTYIFYSLGNAFFDFLYSRNVRIGLRVDGILHNQIFHPTYYNISAKNFGFEKITVKHKTLLFTNEELNKIRKKEYITWFSRKLNLIRFLHRIKMKIFLFQILFSLPFSQKIKLIKNIINFTLNK